MTKSQYEAAENIKTAMQIEKSIKRSKYRPKLMIMGFWKK